MSNFRVELDKNRSLELMGEEKGNVDCNGADYARAVYVNEEEEDHARVGLVGWTVGPRNSTQEEKEEKNRERDRWASQVWLVLSG